MRVQSLGHGTAAKIIERRNRIDQAVAHGKRSVRVRRLFDRVESNEQRREAANHALSVLDELHNSGRLKDTKEVRLARFQCARLPDPYRKESADFLQANNVDLPNSPTWTDKGWLSDYKVRHRRITRFRPRRRRRRARERKDILPSTVPSRRPASGRSLK